MPRHYVQLVVLVTLAVLVGLALPTTREEALAVASPDPVQLDDGHGTLILTRGEDARVVVAPTRHAPVDQLLGYIPDEDAALPDPIGFMPGGRLHLGSGRLYPLDRPMGRIIGVDDRERVRKTKSYPASAAAFIWIDTGARGAEGVPEAALCSGALVAAANLVITAAHCVFDYDGGFWYEDWTITPGAKSARQAPYGSCGWQRIFVAKKWPRTGKPEYDVAAIVLDCQVGERTGWYGAAASRGNGFVSGTHVIHQYPGDKPLATQWQDQGDWVGVGAAGRRAFYTIDTAGGSSGSSVIQRQADGSYNTNATHAYGHTNSNSGALWWRQPWKKVLAKAFNWATRAPQ